MAVLPSDAARNAACNAVVDLLDAGPGPGQLVLRDGTSVVATVTLSDPAFEAAGTAAAGSARAIGGDSSTPIGANNALGSIASASGTPDNFLATDSDDNVCLSGSVTATGGGGDLELTTPDIVSGEPIQITAWTHSVNDNTTPPEPVLIVLVGGQSNAVGHGTVAPDGIPLEEVPYWPRQIGGSYTFAPTDLQSLDLCSPSENFHNHGVELQMGLDLYAAGHTRLGVIKCAESGTFLAEWLPGTSRWDILVAAVETAGDLISAQFGGAPLEWVFVWIQGEAESTAVSESHSLAYAGRLVTLFDGIDDLLGMAAQKIIVRVNENLSGGTWVQNVRDAQDGSGADIVDSDDLTLADGVHYASAPLNTLGTRIAALIP